MLFITLNIYFCFLLKFCNINNQNQTKKTFLYQAVIQTEVGQYVQFSLFDKDEASDDENLGR